jgi:hypothetical protein
MEVSKLLNPTPRTPSPTGAAGRTDALDVLASAAQAAPRNPPRGEQFADLAGGAPPRVQSGALAPRGTGPARAPEEMSIAAGVRPGGDEPGKSSAGGPVRQPPRPSPHFHPYEPRSRESADGSGALHAPVPARQPASRVTLEGGLPPPGAMASSSTAFVHQTGHADSNPLGLTPDERNRIKKNRRGGASTLAFIEDNQRTLLRSLNRDEILQIVTHHGGAIGLRAALDLGPALRAADVADADIVSIAANIGGAQALQAVLDNGPALRAADFANADVVHIAANGGGAQALQAVLAFLPEPAAAGFSHADIVRIAANNGGAQALQAMLNLGPALRAAGLANADIVHIAATKGGTQALQAVRDLGPALRAADLANADIVNMATKSGGAQALQAVLDFLAKPEAARFSKADIVRIAANNGGAPALRALVKHLPALRSRGRTHAQIVDAASTRRGAAGHIARLAQTVP